MSTLISSQTAESTSSDFTLAAGESTTLSLTSATTEALPAEAEARIQIKSTGGTYNTIGKLDTNNRVQVLSATGTFRVFKPMSGAAFGVERD
jgi:hypothetical protein